MSEEKIMKNKKEPHWGNCTCYKEEYCIIHPLKYPKQTEKKEKPYFDLGMITSKDGELSAYTPSQFIKDYAKTHIFFSLYGLVFPEEDLGIEKGELENDSNGTRENNSIMNVRFDADGNVIKKDSGSEKEKRVAKNREGIFVGSIPDLSENDIMLNSKLLEPCKHLNIVPRDDLSYYCKDCEYDTFDIKKDEDGNLTHLLEKPKTEPEKDYHWSNTRNRYKICDKKIECGECEYFFDGCGIYGQRTSCNLGRAWREHKGFEGEKSDKNKELVLGQTADKPMRSIVPPISDSKLPEFKCKICGAKVPKDGDDFCSSECFEKAQWESKEAELEKEEFENIITIQAMFNHEHKLIEQHKRDIHKLILEFENLIDWIEKEYNEQGKISISHYLERVREKIREIV